MGKIKNVAMEDTHSMFAPSSSERWLNCSGSLHLKQAPFIGNSTQKIGVKIHSHLAPYLEDFADISSFHNGEDEELNEILGNLSKYFYSAFHSLPSREQAQFVGYIRFMFEYYRYVVELGLSDLKIEECVDLSHLIPGCYGTPDVVGETPGALHVIDLKCGVVPVRATENYQLMLYALGHYKPEVHKEIHLHIFQKEYGEDAGRGYSYKVTAEFMEMMQAKVRAFISNLTADKVDIVEGSWCKYCPAVMSCPAKKARLKVSLSQINQHPYVMGLEKLEELFINEAELAPLFRAVKKHLEDRFYSDNPPQSDHLYVGHKPGRRVIVDEKLIAYAKANGNEADLLKYTSKTLAQLKKVLPQDVIENITKSEPTKFLGIKIMKNGNPFKRDYDDQSVE